MGYAGWHHWPPELLREFHEWREARFGRLRKKLVLPGEVAQFFAERQR